MFEIKNLVNPSVISIGDLVEISPFNYGTVSLVDQYQIIIVDNCGDMWRKSIGLHHYKACRLFGHEI